jgi:hypothetical protein
VLEESEPLSLLDLKGLGANSGRESKPPVMSRRNASLGLIDQSAPGRGARHPVFIYLFQADNAASHLLPLFEAIDAGRRPPSLRR